MGRRRASGSTTSGLFLTLSSGVFLTYIVYGIVEEEIFRTPGFTFGWFLTMTQFLIVSLLAGVTRKRLLANKRRDGLGGGQIGRETMNGPERRRRRVLYATIGLLDVVTMGMSNGANQYMAYPTKVLFKSCKLLPVMLLGTLAFGKRYTAFEYLAAMCLVSGLAVITVADATPTSSSLTTTTTSTTGLVMVTVSLAADSLMGNLQEMVLSESRQCQTTTAAGEKCEGGVKRGSVFDGAAARLDLLYNTYLIGCVYLLVKLLVTGELGPALLFCAANPSVVLLFALFALLAFIGLNLVLSLIDNFSIFVTVVTITCRQFFTIAISFIFFPGKVFTKMHALAFVLVFVGIWLNIYLKNRAACRSLARRAQIWLVGHRRWSSLDDDRRRHGVPPSASPEEVEAQAHIV